MPTSALNKLRFRLKLPNKPVHPARADVGIGPYKGESINGT